MTDTAGTSFAVVLAAGEGKRMKSSLPKVLHKLAGQPLVGHVLETLKKAQVDSVAVVIGPNASGVEDFVRETIPQAAIAVQAERRGTAHAVLAARHVLSQRADGEVLVLFGDTPLVKSETIENIRKELIERSDVVVTGFYPEDNTGYGRLIVENGRLIAIREERDVTEEERKIKLCNGGIMGFRAKTCLHLLDQIGCDNAQGEYYLTDAPEIALRENLTSTVVEVEENEIFGVNTSEQLAALEEIHRREKASG
jgi:bifunctional UDP-N-acetylglucosamine pyrophosphorylase/glucosamine-1-phosphate N-acetyltransferase